MGPKPSPGARLTTREATLLLVAARSGVGRVSSARGRDGDGALAGGDDPPPGDVVAEQEGGDVAVDEAAQALDGGFGHLVEVEGGGQALGHPVEGDEQVVGLGQLRHPVEGLLVALLGLAEEAAGVAGEDGHQHQLEGPLAAQAQALRWRSWPASRWLGMPTHSTTTPATRTPRPKPWAKPAATTTLSRQKAKGEPQ